MDVLQIINEYHVQHISYCVLLAHMILEPSAKRVSCIEETGQGADVRAAALLLRVGRPHELSSRPLGRPSPGDVGEGWHSCGSKRKDPPHVDKSILCGENSESLCCDDSYLDMIYLV